MKPVFTKVKDFQISFSSVLPWQHCPASRAAEADYMHATKIYRSQVGPNTILKIRDKDGSWFSGLSLEFSS